MRGAAALVLVLLALVFVSSSSSAAAEEERVPARDRAQVALIEAAATDADALDAALAAAAVADAEDEAEDEADDEAEGDSEEEGSAFVEADADAAGFGDEEADDSDKPEPPECPATGHAGDSEQKTPYINHAYSDRSMCHHAIWVCGVRRGACMRGCVGDSYGYTIPRCAGMCNPQMAHCYNLIKERYGGGGGDE